MRRPDGRQPRTCVAPAGSYPRESLCRARSVRGERNYAQASAARSKFLEPYAALQTPTSSGMQTPLHDGPVGFFDAESGMREYIGQFAVVGEQQHAGRIVIQSPQPERPAVAPLVSVRRRYAASGSRIVVIDVHRFVHHEIGRLRFEPHGRAAHVDAIARAHDRSSSRTTLPFTRTLPRTINSFGGAPRSHHSGMRQKFVQTHLLGHQLADSIASRKNAPYTFVLKGVQQQFANRPEPRDMARVRESIHSTRRTGRVLHHGHIVPQTGARVRQTT